jgi:hypothetical protein
MKSVARFSVLGAFAALMCFAPCAFAQGLARGTAAGVVLKSAPSTFLIFGGQGSNQQGQNFGRNGNGGGSGGNGGCGSQGRGDNGWGDNGGCGGKGPGGSTSVPEGGTSLTYLALSGLFCVGAAACRSRQQASVR